MRRYIVRSGDGEPMTVGVVEHEDGYEFTIGEESFRVDSVSRPGSPTPVSPSPWPRRAGRRRAR